MRRRGRARRRAVGPRDRSAAAARRAARASRRARCSRSCTRRRRPASRTTIAPLAALQRDRHAAARRHGHVARRHPGRGRRVGDRRGLLGHAEVPRRAARPRAGQLLRARGRAGARPDATRRSRGTSTSASSPTTSAARAATTTPRRSRCSTRCTRASACCSTKGSKRRGRVTRQVGALLQDALPELGFRLFAEERRLPQLTSVWLPDGVDDAKVRGELLHRFDIEVGGGLGDARGQGLAHRPHGPRRARAVGHHAARRPQRAPLSRPACGATSVRGRCAVRAGRMSRLLAVEAELLDRLADVVEGAVRAPPCPAASCRSPGTSAGTAP